MAKITDEVANGFSKFSVTEMGRIEYLRERLDEWRKTEDLGKKLRTSIPTRAAIDAGLKLRKQATGSLRLGRGGLCIALWGGVGATISPGNGWQLTAPDSRCSPVLSRSRKGTVIVRPKSTL
jgi:hypothetical protein